MSSGGNVGICTSKILLTLLEEISLDVVVHSGMRINAAKASWYMRFMPLAPWSL